MKKLITIILILISGVGISQSKCDRSTAFTADFTFQTNLSATRLNGSVNLGVSAFNKIGAKYNRISVLAGLRIYDAAADQRLQSEVPEVFITPTATMLFKHRFNGYDSKLVHVIGFTAGSNNYLEGSYRVYGAPTGNSLATVGGIVSYSNKQAITIGFVIMGLF